MFPSFKNYTPDIGEQNRYFLNHVKSNLPIQNNVREFDEIFHWKEGDVNIDNIFQTYLKDKREILVNFVTCVGIYGIYIDQQINENFDLQKPSFLIMTEVNGDLINQNIQSGWNLFRYEPNTYILMAILRLKKDDGRYMFDIQNRYQKTLKEPCFQKPKTRGPVKEIIVYQLQ